ncbi:hypothetical protein [Streptomyces sp. NPDC088762]|uniref:hypothetical protein n=1 Tax=Streptomyces sp. NPDC088762 TaxID=3365891 RepID=UPI0037FA9D54
MTEQNTTGAVSAIELDAPQEAQSPAPAPAAKDSRKLFAALRWTAAVLVFAAAGAGTAYGVMQPERTKLPGLSTLPDGRWTYPVQAAPELPAGAPLPKGADNKDGTHYADLRGLLLKAPEGATPDEGVKADKDGVVTTDAFLEEYAAESRPKLKESLDWEGVRKIVGTGWTMPDGTRTHVYLLRFHSSGFADTFGGCNTGTRLTGGASLSVDLVWSQTKALQGDRSSGASLYEEPKPFGDEQTRLGCLQAGDVEAVIIQSRKGGTPVIPFHQAVILQSQLLG